MIRKLSPKPGRNFTKQKGSEHHVFTDLGTSFTPWCTNAFWLKATAWIWSDPHG